MSVSKIERNNCVLIAKSKELRSKYNNSKYRFYTLYDTARKEVISISGDSSYQFRLFSVCYIEYSKENSAQWNLQYDKYIVQNLIDVGLISKRPMNAYNNSNLPSKIRASSIIKFRRFDQYCRSFHDLIRFSDVQFFDGFIKTKSGLTFFSRDFPDSPAFMTYFNKINLPNDPIKGGFEIDGKLEVTMSKDRLTNKWSVNTRYNSRNSKLDIISYDLSDLKRASDRADHDIAYKKLVAWAKRLLEQDMGAINPQKLEDKAQELGFIDISADDLLESVTFKPDYQKKFFTFLRDQSIDTYYSKKGFFFRMKNGGIVWEMPKYGAFTYVFKPQDINVLIDRIKNTPRSAIYADEKVSDALQYIGRRRHPHEDENGEYEESWQKDVNNLIDEA